MSVKSFMPIMSVSCFMWFCPTGEVSAPRAGCTAPVYFVFSFAVAENSKHRNGISTTRLLILIFIVIHHFWRFICFVAVFCSLVDTLTTQRTKQRQKRFICFVWFVLALCPAPGEEAGHRPPPPGGVVLCVIAKCINCLF